MTSETIQNSEEKTSEGEGSKNLINTTDKQCEMTASAKSKAGSKSTLLNLRSNLGENLSFSFATQSGGVVSKGTHEGTTVSEEASEEHPSLQGSWESLTIPSDVDVEVFRSLPEDIQKDLLRQWKTHNARNGTQQTKDNSSRKHPTQPSTSYPKITNFFVKSSK